MHPLKPQELAAAAGTLTQAFWGDPLLQIVLAPDEKNRAARGQWFFEKSLLYGMRWGEASCNDDASAVAIWFPPANTKLTPGRMLRVGMGALPLKVGFGGMTRFMRATSTTEKFHKAVDGPHWYLLAIGTSPARQGTGLGSALIELGASRADEARIPCYLETASESNVAYYTKRGFEVMDQADVLGFTLYGMLRQPR